MARMIMGHFCFVKKIFLNLFIFLLFHMKESGQQETEDPKLDQSFRKGIIMQRYT